MSSIKGVQSVINLLNRAVDPKRLKESTQKLAEMGANTADNIYQMSDYDPDWKKDITVRTKNIKDGTAIVARGKTVLFIEYGTGLVGYGHPDVQATGQYGPGTWSEGENGKGHWDDPKGWYVPGMHGYRTHGNPPAMAMYEARKDVEMNIDRVVKQNLKSLE